MLMAEHRPSRPPTAPASRANAGCDFADRGQAGRTALAMSHEHSNTSPRRYRHRGSRCRRPGGRPRPLRPRGHSVALLGPVATPRDGRTVALFDGSWRFLSGLGIARCAAGQGGASRRDAHGGRQRQPVPPAPVEFRASEIGLDTFGWNIENADLTAILAEEVGHREIETVPGLAREISLGPDGVVLSGEGFDPSRQGSSSARTGAILRFARRPASRAGTGATRRSR